VKLALFFTRGVSLEIWLTSGLFYREKLLYEQMIKLGVYDEVLWITYGTSDTSLAKKLYLEGKLNANITILQPPSWFGVGRLSTYIYSLIAPVIYFKSLKAVDLLKTNQLNGAWTGVLAKWLLNKPLIVRSGYIPSRLELTMGRCSARKVGLMRLIERFVCQRANAVVVSSQPDKKYLDAELGISVDKITVIANYVDTSLFKPAGKPYSGIRYSNRFIYVGRFSSEKNLYHLISAIGKMELGLDLYGSGELTENLIKYGNSINADIRFMGRVANDELPWILQKYKYGALVSFSEGTPKTLLEFMSCGLVCLGTNVDGIREILSDGVTGILAKGTDTESIADALLRTLHAEKSNISCSARDYVVANHSLTSAVECEIKLIGSLI